MKVVVLMLAALATAEAHKHHNKHHHRHASFVQQMLHGIDKSELQPDRHWTQPWPQGIDDGTNDDFVLPADEKKEEPEKPLRFINKGT